MLMGERRQSCKCLARVSEWLLLHGRSLLLVVEDGCRTDRLALADKLATEKVAASMWHVGARERVLVVLAAIPAVLNQ